MTISCLISIVISGSNGDITVQERLDGKIIKEYIDYYVADFTKDAVRHGAAGAKWFIYDEYIVSKDKCGR